MSLRTKLWGQVGIQARNDAVDSFEQMPLFEAPEPVGLRSSQEAWGLPNAGIMIADDLPPSVVPLSQRAAMAGLQRLLQILPNTQQLTRWTEEEATEHLVDFQFGKGEPEMWEDWRTDVGWARTFVQGPCAGDLKKEEDAWVVDASVLAYGEHRKDMAPLGVKVAIHIDKNGPRPAWIQMQDGKKVRPTSKSWDYARLVASAAMNNYVSNVRHVINLHYVAAQAAAVLVHNLLPWHHPVTRLLSPHAAGTLAVNYTASRTFMGPNRIGEQTYAFTWKGIQQLLPIGFAAFTWEEYNIPEVFEQRGTMELIDKKQYPYGEDALLIWGVINDYVEDYLSQYYEDDAAVANDLALQTAFTELDPAVPKPLRASTLSELRLVIARIIHMVSVEHKLVSGIAYDYFTHPYFFPPFAREGKTMEEATPYREEAENGVMFRYAISAMSWSILSDFSHIALDEKGVESIRRFHKALEKAGDTIDKRNKSRSVPFPHLHPRELELSVAV